MRGYRIIALTASVSVFMPFLNSTAITNAIPAIARDLGVPPLSLNLALLANQLALVVMVPASGAVAARIGARNAFMLALALFMTGSICSGLAGSFSTLIAARAFEGLGGGLMMPLSRLLVVRSADKSELINAMNWLLIPGIIGPLMGPALGGFLVTYASWHAIFFVTVPVALAGIAMTAIFVPDIRDENADRLDRKGLMIVSVALVTLILGLGGISGNQPAWLTLAELVTGITLSLAYYRHYRRASAPLLDLSLLSIDSFRHSLLAGNMMRITFAASSFLLPLWFQLVMGMSAAQTGTIVIMGTFGALASRFLGGPLLRLVHPHRVTAFAALVFALTVAALSLLRPEWPKPAFYILSGIQGLALAVGLLVIMPAAYVDLPPERNAAATSLYATAQQLTMALGVVLAVSTLSVAHWITGPAGGDMRAYARCFLMLGVFALIAAAIARRFDVETMGRLRPQRG